jgi:hypothetical protein
VLYFNPSHDLVDLPKIVGNLFIYDLFQERREYKNGSIF